MPIIMGDQTKAIMNQLNLGLCYLFHTSEFGSEYFACATVSVHTLVPPCP